MYQCTCEPDSTHPPFTQTILLFSVPDNMLQGHQCTWQHTRDISVPGNMLQWDQSNSQHTMYQCTCEPDSTHPPFTQTMLLFSVPDSMLQGHQCTWQHTRDISVPDNTLGISVYLTTCCSETSLTHITLKTHRVPVYLWTWQHTSSLHPDHAGIQICPACCCAHFS
jgi:hypothetical protein